MRFLSDVGYEGKPNDSPTSLVSSHRRDVIDLAPEMTSEWARLKEQSKITTTERRHAARRTVLRPIAVAGPGIITLSVYVPHRMRLQRQRSRHVLVVSMIQKWDTSVLYGEAETYGGGVDDHTVMLTQIHSHTAKIIISY